MAGKWQKPKRNIGGKVAGSFFSKVKDILTGGPGKRAGDRLGTGLINMHKKKKK